MAKLKVYRTPIGFHDAYVAAPSQKAALAAWGTDRNLFAQGSAEVVTDEDLSREPLANPGTVVKRSRGTAAEQMAALPETSGQPLRAVDAKTARLHKAPRPDRRALDQVEAEVDAQEQAHRYACEKLEQRISDLERDLGELRRTQHSEASAARSRRDTIAERYDAALKRWRSER